MRVFVFICFLFACIASCASQKDMVHLNNQVNALYREVKEDGERQEKIIGEFEEILKVHEDAQGELRKAIGELELKQGELEGQLRSMSESQEAEQQKSLGAVMKDIDSIRMTSAQLQADLLGARENIQVLTGRIEESNYLLRGVIEKDTTKTDAMTSKMNEFSLIADDLSSRLEVIETYMSAEIEEKRQGSLLEQGSAAEQKGEAETLTPQQREPTESELYDRGLGYHRGGRYQEAMADFETFLRLYPKSDLADNAQFWIGEVYKAQGRPEEAILAYQKVINNYPEGNKVPAAMLNQGFAFEKINDTTTAELVFKRLVKNFPKTSEAEIARKRLQDSQEKRSQTNLKDASP
jgi:tol-pal system protein YbgF